ncbi:MAG TPA: hypothetical protein VLM42_10510 [Bryobacteraceae bacterium]|nr:hypothetical protein [Bryobacteraceae bacterium]
MKIIPRMSQEKSLSGIRSLRPEYRFDYTKARPNRFAGRGAPKPVVVLLDPDVAKVFKNAESVNAVLRAIVAAVPRKQKSSTK